MNIDARLCDATLDWMGKSGFFEYYERARPRRGPAAAPAPNGAATGNSPPTPPANAAPLTVSQLTHQIDRAIKAGIPQAVQVRGQISNFRPNQSSGHFYFTLKDAVNCIHCVMWKSDAANVKFTPADGMELLAGGRIGVYGQQGKYQLLTNWLRPLGQGALELAFQQLRAKLEAQGLFAPERKKPIPRYPIGVVLLTGQNTAALQDMLKVLRRYPWVRLMLYPVPVQGEGAAPAIAAALAHLDANSATLGAQVLLLARGGGSLEDLWPFNEEIVARAIAGCRLPIITGIGHEVDTSIADLVADHHAHTPTEAAQVACAFWRSARDEIDAAHSRVHRAFLNVLRDARHRLRGIERHEAFRRPLDRINAHRQLLDDRQRAIELAMTRRLREGAVRVEALRGRLECRLPETLRGLREKLDVLRRGLTSAASSRLRDAAQRVSAASIKLTQCHPRHGIALRENQLDNLNQRLNRAMHASLLLRHREMDARDRQLQAVGPQNVLRRGYTITSRKKDGVILRASDQIKPGEKLLTRFADGEVESIAQDSRQLTLFE